jgi:3-dehydroquinate synthase
MLWRKAASIPLTRRDVIVALGGGVVGDLAGFLAATWNRGIAVVQVPTTVLAQVDASVGGKTGINLAEGKNLVGAFHQPLAVIADVDTLATLDERTRREGFAEVVKAGLLRDVRILELLEEAVPPFTGGVDEGTVELIRRAIAVKAIVVAADEREAGERAHLNLGHTLGHAIETLEGYGSWLHGEAVAAGTVAALHIGQRMGTTPQHVAARGEALFERLGLPTRLPPMDHATMWQVLGRDKKAERGVRFVLLEDIGRVTVDQPDRALVDEVVDALTDTSGPS